MEWGPWESNPTYGTRLRTTVHLSRLSALSSEPVGSGRSRQSEGHSPSWKCQAKMKPRKLRKENMLHKIPKSRAGFKTFGIGLGASWRLSALAPCPSPFVPLEYSVYITLVLGGVKQRGFI